MAASPFFPSPRRALPWLALAAAWLATSRLLSAEWSVATQYHYGWAVPALCAWLFWWRLPDQPGRKPEGRRWAFCFAAIAVAYLPLRLVLEAFPDWRPALWLAAVTLVALTLGTFVALGGRTWATHFAFPVLFFLTAVPWPTPIESAVIHGLMRTNAAIATEVVTTFGIPAAQRGAVIDLGGTLLGVDEACSGIRSLQSALMLALFAGEWGRLSGRRRVALVAGGLLLAIASNLIRTLWLIVVAARHGHETVATHHDPTATIAMVACVAGIAWLAIRWRRVTTRADSRDAVVSDRGPAVSLAVATLVLLVTGEAVTAWWYRSRDPVSPPTALRVDWPRGIPGFRALEITRAVRGVLRLDEGAAGAWHSTSGADVVVHWLRWHPRRVREALLAKYHTPDVCLPAVGCVLRDAAGSVAVDTLAGTLAFRSYVFEEDGRPLYVFYLLSEDRGRSRVVESVIRERLRLVREGVRVTGQTVVHVAIRNAGDAAAAEAILHREVGTLLRD